MNPNTITQDMLERTIAESWRHFATDIGPKIIHAVENMDEETGDILRSLYWHRAPADAIAASLELSSEELQTLLVRAVELFVSALQHIGIAHDDPESLLILSGDLYRQLNVHLTSIPDETDDEYGDEEEDFDETEIMEAVGERDADNPVEKETALPARIVTTAIVCYLIKRQLLLRHIALSTSDEPGQGGAQDEIELKKSILMNGLLVLRHILDPAALRQTIELTTHEEIIAALEFKLIMPGYTARPRFEKRAGTNEWRAFVLVPEIEELAGDFEVVLMLAGHDDSENQQ
jgi:hypothetical protein